jgi:hypothetical protein
MCTTSLEEVRKMTKNDMPTPYRLPDLATGSIFGDLVEQKGAPGAEGSAKMDSPGEMTFWQNPSSIEKDPIGLAEMSLGENSLLVWKASHHMPLRVTTVDNEAVRTEIKPKRLPHC